MSGRHSRTPGRPGSPCRPIDRARLASWLGTEAGGETVETFLRQIYEDLDAAVRALEAEVGSL